MRRRYNRERAGRGVSNARPRLAYINFKKLYLFYLRNTNKKAFQIFFYGKNLWEEKLIFLPDLLTISKVNKCLRRIKY